MGLFSGKKGMVLGVANDFSIAWAITQKLLAEGAEVGFTHLPGEKMERRVRKLAVPIGAKLITPCDVQNDDDVARVFDQANEVYGGLDFVLHSIAFALIGRPEGSRSSTPAEQFGFKTAMDISVFSLAIVARHAARVLSPGGAILTLTYLGGEKVIPGYNMMGVCKAALDAAVKYLAYDLGPKNIRVNAVSAGPVKTLAASAVGDFEDLAGLYVAVSTLGTQHHPRRSRLSGDVPTLGPRQRNHRRNHARRLRLQRHGLAGPRDRSSQAGRESLSTQMRRAAGDMNPTPSSTADELPTLVGIGLIRRSGSFLVRQRPDQTVYAGYWEFPGGKCEPGELPAEAVARECLEETGLWVAVGRLRYSTLHRYPHGLVELHFLMIARWSTRPPSHRPAQAFAGSPPATCASSGFPKPTRP